MVWHAPIGASHRHRSVTIIHTTRVHRPQAYVSRRFAASSPQETTMPLMCVRMRGAGVISGKRDWRGQWRILGKYIDQACFSDQWRTTDMHTCR
jgi:hypothetical protein